jgi:esterase/lipase superfamily enzyme
MAVPPVTILFATNRARAAADGPWKGPDFTDEVAATPGSPADLSCGVAVVDGIDIAKDAAGAVTGMPMPLSQGGFTDQHLAALLASRNDVLVFVHGTDNDFSDAVTRAAYNHAWLSKGETDPASTFDVILFSWPACAYSVRNPGGEADLLGDLGDYKRDQAQAANSALHFAIFAQQMAVLRKRIGRRRLNLLCHSMGNFMLGGGVETMYRRNLAPPVPIFDEIVLAAADEVNTTFAAPNAGRLSQLRRLGNEITVYYDANDAMMNLSQLVNLTEGWRLGYKGADNEADTAVFSKNVYEFVDCIGVNDSIGSGLLDTHQYYRQSPTVRTDIIATLRGDTPKRLSYDANGNFYTLFPQPGFGGGNVSV